MLFRKTPHHSIDYAILLAMLAGSAVVVRFLSLSKESLVLVTLALSIGYTLWGIAHHKKAGHIDKKIVLEYLSISMLVITLVIFLAV